MMMNPFFFLRIWRFDTRPLVLLGGLVEASSLVQKAAAFLDDDDDGKKRLFRVSFGRKERKRERILRVQNPASGIHHFRLLNSNFLDRIRIYRVLTTSCVLSVLPFIIIII